MKKVLILVNGEYGNYYFCKPLEGYDMIICADNGMHHARHLKLIPDLIVGDFDSSSLEDLAFFKEMGVKIETFDSHKDATDTELAVDRAVEAGATEIIIWGGVGTRLDHSLGNVQILYKLLKKNIKATLMNPYNTVYLAEKHLIVQGKVGQTISLLPFAGAVKGITTRFLEYPLKDATLSLGSSLGISNVMEQASAEIKIEEGILLVIKAND